MASIKNLNIDQGANFSTTIIVYQDDGVTVQDLTEYTIASMMRKNYTSTKKHLITAAVLVAQEGTITLNLTAAATAAIKSGYYFYDVEITSGSGVITRIQEGKINMKPEITSAMGTII